MNKHKTILATAYAVNPYKGSEDGMGWNFLVQIARFNYVIAVTRRNNRNHIEKYLTEHPDQLHQNITFLYYDLPYWMRFWKKGGRGAMLYFWMWQRALPGFIKKQKLSFDIVHNVNFHNDWTPSYLWKLTKPFVWGPIGHHASIPAAFLKPYSRSYWIKDRMALLIKKIFWNISPSLQKTITYADHILCMNSHVKDVINLKSKPHSIMPSVATEDYGHPASDRKRNKFTLLSAGRLIPLKGFDLTLRAYSDFMTSLTAAEKKNCELIIVGSGPLEKYYKQMASEQNIQLYVRFVDWMDRAELLKLYQEVSVFLFPSHEGAGMVVAEAMSFGVPVICLDNSGPGEFIDLHSGIAVKATTPEEAVKGLTEAIHILHKDPTRLEAMSNGARRRYENFFHWNRRGEELQHIYQNLGA